MAYTVSLGAMRAGKAAEVLPIKMRWLGGVETPVTDLSDGKMPSRALLTLKQKQIPDMVSLRWDPFNAQFPVRRSDYRDNTL